MCKSTNQAADNAPTSVRLVNAWIPSIYGVKLLCDLDHWSTEVVETITCIKADPYLKSGDACSVHLHIGKAIDIREVYGAEVLDVLGSPMEGVSVTASIEADYRTLDGVSEAFSETIRFKITGVPEDAQQFRFVVRFVNPMQEELRGLYRCKYTDNTGVAKRMASTHFEPMGARLCYICLDEPAARATFRLTVALPEKDELLTVISNSPLKEAPAKIVHTDLADGKTSFETRAFADIDRCPPYLTSIVVGDLEFISATSAPRADGTPGTPIRFFTVKGKKEHGTYSLQCATRSLEYFEEFFQSRFPLPKLDLVAVPDFPIGGMENWGCITLVETCLIASEAKAGISTLKRVANLVSHEVSHNWFGNLVGIDWWEGLWLKEGFASWCGYQGTQMFRPTLDAIADATSEVFDALATDGHQASHPVEVPIINPADITQVFDEISYSKGMGVVSMLENYLGREAFSKGIAAYVDTYQYRNTKTPQLWEEIEKATEVPVAAIMNSFTTQQGFPIISVSTEATSLANTKEITLAQHPYAYAGNGDNVISDTMWNVPLRIEIRNVATGESVLNFKTILSAKSETVTLPPLENVKPEHHDSLVLIVNPGGGFYYRTLYKSDILLAKMWDTFAQLPKNYRQAILNDFNALYLSGDISVEELNTRLSYVLETERDHTVLLDVLGISGQLKHTIIYADVCIQHHLVSPRDEQSTGGSNTVVSLANIRFYQAALELYNKDVNTLIPETKALRQAALEHALKYETNEVANGRLAKANATLSNWAESIAVQFLESCKEELKGTDSFAVVKDFDTLGACIGAAMVSRSAPASHAHNVWAAYKMLDSDPEKGNLVLRALCRYGDDRDLLRDIAKLCTRNSIIRSQLGGVVFMNLAQNDFFGTFAWEHIRQDWEAIDKQWGRGQFRLQRIIEHLAHYTDALCTQESAAEFKAFFEAHPCPAASLAIKRGVECIKLKAFLSERDAKTFWAADHDE